jgi:predicted membrane protein
MPSCVLLSSEVGAAQIVGDIGFRVTQTWSDMLFQPLISCMSLGMWLDFPGAQIQ